MVGPIPAYAGQPCLMHSVTMAVRAYPRVCGATAGPVFKPLIDLGLSPRMRGNRNSGAGDFGQWGPIPAYAGQPMGPPPAARLHRAYPRVCGATVPWQEVMGLSGGLSPRMRGNLHVSAYKVDPRGPIPAYAGQPSLMSWA